MESRVRDKHVPERDRMAPVVLTAGQYMTKYQIGRSTFYNFVKEGKIKTRKYGPTLVRYVDDFPTFEDGGAA